MEREESMNKNVNIDKVVKYIRVAIIYIMTIILYITISWLIYQTNNSNLIGWLVIICFVIGWNIIERYEEYSWNSFNFITKFLLSIIGIPLLIAFWLNKLFDLLIYKKNDNCQEKNSTLKVNENIKNDTMHYKYNIRNNYNTKNEAEDIEYKEKYICERCFKEISEEEYELYDCMCEQCFSDEHINKDGYYDGL